MNRPTLFLMLALIGLAGPTSAGERILISNQSNDSAELLDLATLKSLAVTKIGQQPLTATVTYDRRFGLVASVGYTTNAGSVAVLDLTATGLPVIATVSQNSRAYGVEAAPNGKYAVVTRVQGSTAQLQLVDLSASPPVDLGSPIAIPSGRSAYGVQISPDGSTAYVLDFSGATLSVFDLTKSPPAVIKQLATNGSAIFLRLSNDGRRLVIPSIANPAQAGVWSTESLIPVKTGNVPVGSNPGAIPSFDPGNRFAAVIASSGKNLTVIDTHSTPPAALGTTPTFGSDLRGVTVTTDGLRAWGACRSQSTLYEIDLSWPSTPTLTNRTVAVARGPNSLVAFGEVHAHGVPAIGTMHPIYVTSPTDAGKGYLLAASFATQPGIPIGSRRVPLNPDDLFALSRLVPSLFQNFTGVLNAKGQATAAIQIPAAPALRGISFLVGGVVIDPTAPQGIGTITNAERIVVQ